jgi:hypothetical protein
MKLIRGILIVILIFFIAVSIVAMLIGFGL